MARAVAAAAALFLAQAGCSLAPRYERPAPPVTEIWEAGAAAGPSGVADLGWREVFQDPALQALVALALENNRDLRAAALAVELARAQYRIERADRLPAVSATGTATRQHLDADLSPTGSAARTTSYTVRAWRSDHPAFEAMTEEAREKLAKDPDWYAKGKG